MVPSLTGTTQNQVFSKFPKPHVDFLVLSKSSSATHGPGEGGEGVCWLRGQLGGVQRRLSHSKSTCVAVIWHSLSPRSKDFWGKYLTYSCACPPALGLLLPEAEGLWGDSRTTSVIPGTPQIHAEWGAKDQPLGDRGNADGQGGVPGSAWQPGAQSLVWCNGTTELLFIEVDNHTRNSAGLCWL